MKAISVALVVGLMACALIQPFGSAKAAKFEGKVLYSFCSEPQCTDGQAPQGGLIAVNGLLYGTTVFGGKAGAVCGGPGLSCPSHGTVYSLDPDSGAQNVIYAFCKQRNCADGANPAANLISVNGLLYGTTVSGGRPGCGGYGCGTVFSLDPNTGAETVLYSFCSQDNCADGFSPLAALLDVNGVLYGTTWGGGGQYCPDHHCGTVFSLDPTTGTEKALYSFCSQANCTDGQWIQSSLIAVNGVLFGTTRNGGVTGCGGSYTCGTAFSIDLGTGNEKVVYTFCSRTNCPDGAFPMSNLIEVDGTLYGTTSFGGVYPCQNMPVGCGTAFALDPTTGSETVLHSFGSGVDTYHPEVGLIDMNGKLYGTAISGGDQNAGAAFSLDPAGKEAVIWSFCGCSFPTSLTALNGKLYGALHTGGSHSGGMVFVISKTH